MDSERFDAWTRRRFGVVAGGAIAGLFAVSDLQEIVARKRRKKRRKKKNKQQCTKAGDRCTEGEGRPCCRGLRCDFPAGLSMSTFCCGREDQRCDDDFDCCFGFRCNTSTERCREVL